MTAQNRTTLKSYFETRDKPTQAQFADLIDSFLLVQGDTMTGELNLSGIPVSALGAAPKQYVDAIVSGYAKLASPAFTGVPTAPTAAALNNSTQVATTAYADAVQSMVTALAVGSYIWASNNASIAAGALRAAANITVQAWTGAAFAGTGDALSGTWRALMTSSGSGVLILWQRVA